MAELSGSFIDTYPRDTLETEGAVLDRLQFICEAHGKVTTVQTAEDFAKSPAGGCDAPCGAEMRCGHVCQLPCHPPSVRRHVCREPCAKLCRAGLHACPLPCDALCEPCRVPVEIQLGCGHAVTGACHEAARADTRVCTETVLTPLPCGHTARARCGQTPVCGDTCSELLPCGHACGLACHHPSQEHAHPRQCEQPCRRRVCSEPEHGCPRRCGEECAPCQVLVTRSLPCGHLATLLCSEEAASQECSSRCGRQLACGHSCR